MNIRENVMLAPYTSFQVGGPAEYFASVSTEDELCDAVRFAEEHALPVTVFASGTNVLIADTGLSGLVIKNDIAGVRFKEDGDDVLVTAGAGEVFDELVAESVARGLWGLENLSAIPGSVGATPIQNVGAYGVEVQDVLACVRVYDLNTRTFGEFTVPECRFGYRDSLFKQPEGKRYVVTAVTYRLSRSPRPVLEYRDLVERFGGATPTLGEIRDAVIDIRAKKFPDWREVGTAGSFFKNPVIPTTQYAALRERYPDIPGFSVGSEHTKVPLGWIIEHVLNKRGYRYGNVGTFSGQALVLINHGGATAHEVETFAAHISDEVCAATGITPEWEVTYLSS